MFCLQRAVHVRVPQRAQFEARTRAHISLTHARHCVRARSLTARTHARTHALAHSLTAEHWATKLSDLNVAVFGEELEWVNKFGSKGILHRHIQSLETKSIIEVTTPASPRPMPPSEYSPEVPCSCPQDIDPTIRVARGFGCSTTDDLVEAWRRLDCKQARTHARQGLVETWRRLDILHPVPCNTFCMWQS
jgi:hypothetical protein